MDFLRVFGWAIAFVLFALIAIGNANACGGDEAVYPETVETPTVEFRL
jgi:hypothetical protein